MLSLIRSFAAASAALFVSAFAHGATGYTQQIAPMPLVDINNRGVILAASGPLAMLWNGKPEGAGSVWTPVTSPAGGLNPVYTGLSDANEVVGSFFSMSLGRSVGFVTSASGVEIVDVPGTISTNVRAVSPNGRFLGLRAYSELGTVSSYLLDRSTGLFSNISPSGSYGSSVEGVSDSGRAVGRMATDSGTQAFVYENGNVVPFSIAGDAYTSLDGLSDAGYLVGTSGPNFPMGGGPELNYGFITHGADTWKFEQGTRLFGVNSAGVAVGAQSYTGYYGILLTPVPEPDTAVLLVAGLAVYGARRLRRVAKLAR